MGVQRITVRAGGGVGTLSHVGQFSVRRQLTGSVAPNKQPFIYHDGGMGKHYIIGIYVHPSTARWPTRTIDYFDRR